MTRVALLTREYPPEVYGGAGVHVEYLARELARLVDLTVHCFGADRPGAVAHRPWDELAGPAPHAGRSPGDLGRPGDGRRRSGSRSRAQPHVVREPRGPLREARVRDPARRHRPQPRADAPVEGRAAGRRLRALELLRANGARATPTRSSPSRTSTAATYSPCYPDRRPGRVSVIYNGIDTDEYAPDATTDVLERYGVDPEAPSVVFVGRITRQKGLAHLLEAALDIDPAAQLVLCAGAPDTPELGRRDRGEGRAAACRARQRGLDRADAAEARGDPAAQPRDRLRLPVDLRAARHRQPRGDGLRGGGRGDERRAASRRSSRTA